MKKRRRPITDFGYADSPPIIDGHTYKTVKIGKQEWFAENLKTTVYRNGDAIFTNLPDDFWDSLMVERGALVAYEGEILYNWYAVTDIRSLCPRGWRVPTDEDWKTLERELGMSESHVNSIGHRGTDQGTQMKTDYGWLHEGNGTNSSGFSASPSGYRSGGGRCEGAGYGVVWWTSAPINSFVYRRQLDYDLPSICRDIHNPIDDDYEQWKRYCFSVRCVRDVK